MTATIKRPSLGHHMTVEYLRRVCSYPAHELAHLQRPLGWHAARSKASACNSIHLITIPESSCSRS